MIFAGSFIIKKSGKICFLLLSHGTIVNGDPVSMIFEIQGKITSHHTEAVYTP